MPSGMPLITPKSFPPNPKRQGRELLLLADSKQVQQTARKRLKVLAMTATPIALRSALSQVAHTPIQVKNRFPLYQPAPLYHFLPNSILEKTIGTSFSQMLTGSFLSIGSRGVAIVDMGWNVG